MPHVENYVAKEYSIGIEVEERRTNVMIVRVKAHSRKQAQNLAMEEASDQVWKQKITPNTFSHLSEWQTEDFCTTGSVVDDSHDEYDYCDAEIDMTDREPAPWVDPRQQELPGV